MRGAIAGRRPGIGPAAVDIIDIAEPLRGAGKIGKPFRLAESLKIYRQVELALP